MIRRSLFVALCLTSSLATANCFMRSDIKLTRQNVDFGPTDIQRMVTPEGKGQRCVVRYRVNVDDEWQTAEGVGQGATETEACAQALDLKKAVVLAQVEPKRISAETHMVCSDLPEIKIRSVRIGEVVWESETDLHRHPQERKYFTYKQTQCRMFTERNVKDRNLYTYQGVICRVNSRPDSRWRVVDKY